MNKEQEKIKRILDQRNQDVIDREVQKSLVLNKMRDHARRQRSYEQYLARLGIDKINFGGDQSE